VIVGYFSARQKDLSVRMEAAAADLTARGARVVGRVVQRRGVSNGGVRRMTLPYSSRTLLSSGKAREVAALCEESGADAVIFLNALTEHQRRVLTEAFGCPAVSLS
jgi:50S ribosomal subunit-associated GTPase HflX